MNGPEAQVPSPLATDPRRDSWAGQLVGGALATLRSDELASDMTAVVLAGSGSRGEASVLLGPSPRLLGDLEFLVIVRRSRPWAAVRRRMVELGHAATRALGATIEFTAADIDYLRRRIRPSIFAFDLLRHGRVVWGDPAILSEGRAFEAVDIPGEDALNLVMNRLMELEFAEPEEPVERGYRRAKVVLDLAGSLLAFSGQHTARYAARPAALARMGSEVPRWRRDRFEPLLEAAAREKVSPTPDGLRAFDAETSIDDLRRWAEEVWLFEAARLYGLHGGDVEEAVRAYLRHESARTRLRGWLKFLLHPLRPAGSLQPRRMARLWSQASPQSLTYAAAVVGRAASNHDRPDWRRLAEALRPAAEAPEVTWAWLIRNQ